MAMTICLWISATGRTIYLQAATWHAQQCV
jgi:hypothetical protein